MAMNNEKKWAGGLIPISAFFNLYSTLWVTMNANKIADNVFLSKHNGEAWFCVAN